MNKSQHQVIFIMGVSGAGKSTVGTRLAGQLNIPFYDGDDFHSDANKAKMKAGHPLNDTDRMKWLKTLNLLAVREVQLHSVVIACSALKESYRQQLSTSIESQCRWVLLRGSFDQIEARISKRQGHFMPASLLRSQFDLLETPSQALSIDIQHSPDEIVDLIIKSLSDVQSHLGIIGLGVMGSSLARNMARQGFNLSMYNQYVKNKEERVAEKLIEKHPELQQAKGFEDLQKFVESLSAPRIIVCMIPAGNPLDSLIENIAPLLSPNDFLIDCGNSHYKDTENRQRQLEARGIHYMGVGVSGGEEGALNGPSIMVGGSRSDYDQVKQYLQSIAAKDKGDNPCCAHVGKGGSGHFVKMVHNGIEYAEMQLLAEVYGILRWTNQLDLDEIADVFESWLETDVNSYLLEISRDILRKKEGDKWLLDLILDVSESKGTGGWTTIAAAELEVSIPTITESLFARFTSADKQVRKQLNEELGMLTGTAPFAIDALQKAYRLARISNHQQGFNLIAKASKQYGWQIDLSALSRIWTNGCIIRSTLMENLEQALKNNGNIFLDSTIQSIIREEKEIAARLVGEAIKSNVPIPALTSAVVYLQSVSRGASYGNFIQAQRDYFGAHGYQRVDDQLNQKAHARWKE